MANTGFVSYTIAVGLFSAAFAYWWTRWIFEENPEIPSERRTFHSIVVFALLTSSWFVAFGITQEDIGNLPAADGRGTITNLTIVTYAVISATISLALFLWDIFCRGTRGQPPHLIPAFYAAVAMGASCCLVVPGLTMLSVYSSESTAALSYPHQQYIESLSTKGIIATCVGFAVDGGILLLYMKDKFISSSSSRNNNTTTQNSESNTQNENGLGMH
ncbi:MAG: hypothetical protein SGBAC_010642 [Bacillariaceae sp.]